MRVKTSITLPAELLARLDVVNRNRSAVLEQAALAYLAKYERDRKDIRIISDNAERLNAEALDTLDYQLSP